MNLSFFSFLMGLWMLVFLFSPGQLKAQGASATYEKGLTIFLKKQDSNRYLRFLVFNQIWLRNTDLNPGTAIDGVPTKNTWSVVNRRLRLFWLAQLHKRYMIVGHIGVNSQTFNTGGNDDRARPGQRPYVFVHDAYNEFSVIMPQDVKNVSLDIGFGLHYWAGLSRVTQGGTINVLGVDYNSFNWPTGDTYDQFSRMMGFYAKGYVGKLNYIFNVGKPFTQRNELGNLLNQAVLNNTRHASHNFNTGGYVYYDFFEHESMKLPFRVGTYAGENKKYFSLGTGYHYHPNASIAKTRADGGESLHPLVFLAGDFFLNLPLGRAKSPGVFNIYGVYYNWNYGPNYIRHVGVASIGSPDPNAPSDHQTVAGAGNFQPTLGTGHTGYVQVGYTFASKKEIPFVRYQPYLIYYMKKFDYFTHSSHQFDVGINFYFQGHHAKVTLQYSTRPVYSTRKSVPFYKGESILGCQIFL